MNTEKITIRHCPTEQMLADFFTKPLQGNLFRRFHDLILGYKHVNTLALPVPVSAEERVGNRTETGKVRASSVPEEATAQDQGILEEKGEEKENDTWTKISDSRGFLRMRRGRNLSKGSLIGNNPVN